MNAMSSAERSKRYRQRKKEQGVSQGEATRLGPQASQIVSGLSALCGESKAEIVRILMMRGAMEVFGDDLEDTLLVLQHVAESSGNDTLADEKAKGELVKMIRDGINQTRVYIEEIGNAR